MGIVEFIGWMILAAVAFKVLFFVGSIIYLLITKDD